jgi:hypothetical protein
VTLSDTISFGCGRARVLALRPTAHYAEVATIYTEALNSGRPPTQEVANRNSARFCSRAIIAARASDFALDVRPSVSKSAAPRGMKSDGFADDLLDDVGRSCPSRIEQERSPEAAETSCPGTSSTG